MARPIKTAEDKRDFTIEVRVTFVEKTQIKSNAKDHGLNTSDFLRGFAVGAKPLRHVPNIDREILLRHLAESNKIGSNFNQIARQLNRKVNNETVSIDTLKAIQYSLTQYNLLNIQLMELLS